MEFTYLPYCLPLITRGPLGYLEAIIAILRLENENLDLFWVESNPISFLAHCIFSDTFTEHYCTEGPFMIWTKDDTLPCKRQALAWQKEPKAWTQALQRYKQFFYQSGV